MANVNLVKFKKGAFSLVKSVSSKDPSTLYIGYNKGNSDTSLLQSMWVGNYQITSNVRDLFQGIDGTITPSFSTPANYTTLSYVNIKSGAADVSTLYVYTAGQATSAMQYYYNTANASIADIRSKITNYLTKSNIIAAIDNKGILITTNTTDNNISIGASIDKSTIKFNAQGQMYADIGGGLGDVNASISSLNTSVKTLENTISGGVVHSVSAIPNTAITIGGTATDPSVGVNFDTASINIINNKLSVIGLTETAINDVSAKIYYKLVRGADASGDTSILTTYSLKRYKKIGTTETELGTAGTIDLQKEYFIKSGSVVTYDGKDYINLIFNTNTGIDSSVLIEATSLVDVYTGSEYIDVTNHTIIADTDELWSNMITGNSLFSTHVDKDGVSTTIGGLGLNVYTGGGGFSGHGGNDDVSTLGAILNRIDASIVNVSTRLTNSVTTINTTITDVSKGLATTIINVANSSTRLITVQTSLTNLTDTVTDLSTNVYSSLVWTEITA